MASSKTTTIPNPGSHSRQRVAPLQIAQTYIIPLIRRLTASRIIGPKMLSILKAIVFAVFVLNIRSWPLAWHIRIWRWAILKRLAYRWFRMRTMFYSAATRGKLEDKWVENCIPLGAHPLDNVWTFSSWASLDESDFNMHLSNSSYGKALDSARFKLAVQTFPMFFRGGGWIPLAATQFHFICEIPILASYEVRSSIGAWDSKWFYIVSKFVVPGSKSKKRRKSKKQIERANGNPDALPSLRTPACSNEVASESASGTGTPLILPSNGAISGKGLSAQLLKAGAQVKSESDDKDTSKVEADEWEVEEPDGAQVHTVAISRCCFKMGRITVPPAIVFALAGLSSEGEGSVSKGAKAFPPHWDAVRSTFSPYNDAGVSDNGKASAGAYGTYDPSKISKFLKGGWREVKDEDKWWDRAFDSIKEENERRLKKLEGRV